MEYTAIIGKPRWVDLSPQHAIARQELQTRLKDYFEGKAVAPVAIVGAFGSGKSELMSVGYRMAWENEFPAFWLNLEGLLKLMPEKLTPAEFTDWLNQKIDFQIEALREWLGGEDRLRELLVPHPREITTAKDYLGWLGIPVERAKSAANKKVAVLFLDEMEAHYTGLLARVPSDDRAPLRVLQQAVEQKETSFFLVMSFGLASAYEALSGAEARRRGFIPVPLPGPSEFAKSLLNNDALANFIWWCSRGRPGWALPIWDSWRAFLVDWARMPFEKVYDLVSKTPNIEGLPVVNWKAITGVSAKGLEMLKDALLSLGPTKLDKLRLLSGSSAEIDELGQFYYLAASRDLTPITDLEDALTFDIIKLLTEYAPSSGGELISEVKLREYLRKVLRSLSSNEQICFGGWKSETDAFAKAWLAPLLTLLHDLILEFEGDTEDGSIIVDCLYRMGASWDIFSGQVKDPWSIANKFSKTKALFEAYGEMEASYIQATPKLIEELFPLLVVKPVLRLTDKAESDITRQRSILKGSVGTSGQFLRAVRQSRGIDVEFILLPSADLCGRLQRSFLQQIHRDEYLPHQRVLVVLNLDEELRETTIDATQNSDVFILKELGKLSFEPLKERRLQDFLISLWYNCNVLGLGNSELFGLLDEIPSAAQLSKASRRTIDHYKTLAMQTLTTLSDQVTTLYLAQMRQVFPIDDPEFPESRVRSLYERIREDRTVDSIVVAVGAYYSRVATLNTLGQIRDLTILREFSKGYKEFLEDYSVIREKGTHGPSASMRDVLDYLDQRRGFAKLLEEILPKLASMPYNVRWNTMTEDLGETPMGQMFAALSRERRVALKALYVTSLLSAHRQQLSQEVARLKARIIATAQQYQALTQDIAKFNGEVKVKILSDSKCRSIAQALIKLGDLLDVSDTLHAGTLYVVYRIAEAIQGVAQDRRDEWVGEKGLQGWKDRLRLVMDLSQHIQKYEQELEEAFLEHASIKIDAMGNLEAILNQKVKKPLKEGADKVMLALGSAAYELTDGIPSDRIDVEPLKEALSSVNTDVNEICNLANSVDDLLNSIGTLANSIVDFSTQATKGDGDENHGATSRRKR